MQDTLYIFFLLPTELLWWTEHPHRTGFHSAKAQLGRLNSAKLDSAKLNSAKAHPGKDRQRSTRQAQLGKSQLGSPPLRRGAVHPDSLGQRAGSR